MCVQRRQGSDVPVGQFVPRRGRGPHTCIFAAGRQARIVAGGYVARKSQPGYHTYEHVSMHLDHDGEFDEAQRFRRATDVYQYSDIDLFISQPYQKDADLWGGAGRAPARLALPVGAFTRRRPARSSAR